MPHAFNFGDLGLHPVTNDWGFSRGQPVDRYYIDAFLERHAEDISGHVVEVGGPGYTTRFGAAGVRRSDVWDIDPANRGATIVADLCHAPKIQTNTFDCFILPQVLELIMNVSGALGEIHRVLKPGGVALITVPGISHISPFPVEAASWSWSFYPRTLSRLLTDAGFLPERVDVAGWGNLKTTVAFLAQLAQSDLSPGDYAFNDARYPLIVTARAVKSQS